MSAEFARGRCAWACAVCLCVFCAVSCRRMSAHAHYTDEFSQTTGPDRTSFQRSNPTRDWLQYNSNCSCKGLTLTSILPASSSCGEPHAILPAVCYRSFVEKPLVPTPNTGVNSTSLSTIRHQLTAWSQFSHSAALSHLPPG